MSSCTYTLLFCKACTQSFPHPGQDWVYESENCPWMYVFQELNVKHTNICYNFWYSCFMKPEKPGRDRLETWPSPLHLAAVSLFRPTPVRLARGKKSAWESAAAAPARLWPTALEEEGLRLRDGGLKGKEVDQITGTPLAGDLEACPRVRQALPLYAVNSAGCLGAKATA